MRTLTDTERQIDERERPLLDQVLASDQAILAANAIPHDCPFVRFVYMFCVEQQAAGYKARTLSSVVTEGRQLLGLPPHPLQRNTST